MKRKRHNLYVFRHDHRLTQTEMSKKCGVSRATYAFIERGERSGTSEFWSKLQQSFNVPDADMYPLQKIEEEQGNEARTQSSS